MTYFFVSGRLHSEQKYFDMKVSNDDQFIAVRSGEEDPYTIKLISKKNMAFIGSLTTNTKINCYSISDDSKYLHTAGVGGTSEFFFLDWEVGGGCGSRGEVGHLRDLRG
jgi:hypothetical protein